MVRACRINECTKPHLARGYCTGHYYSEYSRKRDRGPCEVLDCDRPARYCTQGLSVCGMHNARIYRSQNLSDPARGTADHVPGASWAHQLVEKQWGRAVTHQCINCERQARDWAYDGTDPSEILEGKWLYSRWPEFYMPMCRSCHKKLDGAKQGEELREYRELKHATGLTGLEIRVRLGV